MALVQINPGDILCVRVSDKDVISSAYGADYSVASVWIHMSYNDLLHHVSAVTILKGKTAGVTRKKTPGAKFSRHISLAAKALQTRCWSTGNAVTPEKIMTSLQKHFKSLPTSEYKNITPRARELLSARPEFEQILNKVQETIHHGHCS